MSSAGGHCQSRSTHLASQYNVSAYACFIAGGIAAAGGALLLCGLSPTHVSAREAGGDRFMNQVQFFGPAVLLSWVAFAFAKPKGMVLLFNLVSTLIYLIGFMRVNGAIFS